MNTTGTPVYTTREGRVIHPSTIGTPPAGFVPSQDVQVFMTNAAAIAAHTAVVSYPVGSPLSELTHAAEQALAAAGWVTARPDVNGAIYRHPAVTAFAIRTTLNDSPDIAIARLSIDCFEVTAS